MLTTLIALLSVAACDRDIYVNEGLHASYVVSGQHLVRQKETIDYLVQARKTKRCYALSGDTLMVVRQEGKDWTSEPIESIGGLSDQALAGVLGEGLDVLPDESGLVVAGGHALTYLPLEPRKRARTLAVTDGFVFTPSISPDGESVAYAVRKRGVHDQIWMYSFGSNRKSLVGPGAQPVWMGPNTIVGTDDGVTEGGRYIVKYSLPASHHPVKSRLGMTFFYALASAEDGAIVMVATRKSHITVVARANLSKGTVTLLCDKVSQPMACPIRMSTICKKTAASR
jgi:hypothetical protein